MAGGGGVTFRAVWQSEIPAIAAHAKSRAGKAVAKAARDIEAGAKQRAPVDTGNLRNSILAVQVRSFNWRVDANAYYSIYQEFGTSKMAAHPFLIPAAEAVTPSFVAAMSQIAA